MTKPNEENPRGVSRSAGEDRTKTRGGIVCSHDTYAPGNNGSEAVVDQKGWGQFARAIRPIRLGAEKKKPTGVHQTGDRRRRRPSRDRSAKGKESSEIWNDQGRELWAPGGMFFCVVVSGQRWVIGVCPSRIGSICPFLLRKIKAAGKESERVDRGSILGYDLAKRTCMDSYFLRPILCARPLLVESNKNLHVFSPCHRKKKTFAFTWRLLPCPRESKKEYLLFHQNKKKVKGITRICLTRSYFYGSYIFPWS